jgi:endoglucanase
MTKLLLRAMTHTRSCVVLVLLPLLLGVLVVAAVARTSRVARVGGSGCADPASQYSATRDPSNPLALSHSPGGDPLKGARFFVPGPAKGSAASTIAQMVGDYTALGDVDESWASFSYQLHHGALAQKLAGNRALARKVAELSKIAAEPEAQRISSYVMGGGPGAVYAQTTKLLCSNLGADPGSIPIFNTYFLHPDLGGCPTTGQIRGDMPTFHRRVDEMAEAIGRRPAVLLLEIDGLGASGCVAQHGSLGAWEGALRYEVGKMATLPHAVVYVEAGYSDANTAQYTAKALNRIGIDRIRGFFTNDTHLEWTINEVRWATKISKLTHGAHFIVDTADNGRGPLLNKDPATEGNEDLCNPPGRGLGPKDSTATGFRYADAWMWTHPPGNSSGCGGGPPGGVFWPARALTEAEHANQRLGPAYPSRPY